MEITGGVVSVSGKCGIEGSRRTPVLSSGSNAGTWDSELEARTAEGKQVVGRRTSKAASRRQGVHQPGEPLGDWWTRCPSGPATQCTPCQQRTAHPLQAWLEVSPGSLASAIRTGCCQALSIRWLLAVELAGVLDGAGLLVAAA